VTNRSWGKVSNDTKPDKTAPAGTGRKALLTGCLAHLTHDGFNDALYVFFPLWQAQFGLSFAEVGLLKTLFSGTMAGFQVPSGFLAGRVGEIRLLLGGTVLTCLAVMGLGWVTAPLFLGLLLVAGGLGESVQHPLSSSLISAAYPETKARRTALSTFNVAGDIGKLTVPGLAAVLIAFSDWQTAAKILALMGLAVTLVVYAISRGTAPAARPAPGTTQRKTVLLGWDGYQAFWSLATIGIIDSATRMGFLTFFPFILRDKGAEITTIGLALTLVFAGGATGKFVCGILATRVGVLRSVIVTEVTTALCIFGILSLSLDKALLLAPLLGVVLNGTSSVLYGSVPELVTEDRRNQAFALFYTAAIGAGAVSPSIYGLFSDTLGIHSTVTLVALVVLATVPLTLPLRGKLAH
jgi:MFS family permease